MRTAQVTHREKLFLAPAEIAAELGVSSSTVLRLIHGGKLPAIAVSERIYRIPAASFEMFKAGTLKGRVEAEIVEVDGPIPDLGQDEELPPAAASHRVAER